MFRRPPIFPRSYTRFPYTTFFRSAYVLIFHLFKMGLCLVILYEYPWNERVRALLRIEYLFDRLFFFAEGEDVRHHQIAVSTLFDLLDICDLTDLRGAVLQDLERHRGTLGALRQHPGVDTDALDSMLAEIQTASSCLGAP